MYALKAARDAVNQAGLETRLYQVMTGSHRDKLATLFHNPQAPIFCVRERDVPKLEHKSQPIPWTRCSTIRADGPGS